MAGPAKYSRYLLKNITGKSDHPEITAPAVHLGKTKCADGRDFSLKLSTIERSFVFEGKPEVSELDRFFVFIATDPYKPELFQAELEMSLGKEQEKYVIREPRVVYIPAGLPHFPLTFNKVDSPFFMLEVSMTASPGKAGESWASDNGKYSRLITAPKVTFNTMVIKTYIGDKLIREQKKPMKDWNYTAKDVGAGSLTMYWYNITEPMDMYEPPHAHDHDMFAVHFGSDPLHMDEFDAELHCWFGEEAEENIIDSPTVAHIAAGLVHRHVDMRIIKKPFMLINIFMNPEYQKARTLQEEE